ncbi:MAG: di-trans,poly-cis-decaprenylcistransferase [Verrucomicrobia bacterium]|nr:di-trans,poly-cis-decaprenylcistransferase [Verrucomicrobiota bacterium]
MNSLIIEEQPIGAQASTYSEEDLVQIDRDRIPYHIAIIMDGNRRWAKEKNLPPMVGHWKGAEALPGIVRAAADLGVKVLTVYAFSTENWGRSPEEVDALMHLFNHYLLNQKDVMIDEGVRLESIGDISKLPLFVQETLLETKKATFQGSRIDLVLALNYGGRDDIRRAVMAMLEDNQKGHLSSAEISEELISRYLDTAKWPDPDILIRTSGEKRQSNFLLWQLCYSEFYHTDVLWPDFEAQDLLLAVKEYQKRERRLGKA